jgi:N-acetylglucosamine kinase-like BadF-type ATPase
VARLIENLKLAHKVVVDNDAMIALMGALGDRPGLILIAGTGSIALGRNERGQRVRVGGWGYLLGDEGSGFFIARAALSAVMRAYDGRERETALTEKLVEALGLTDPQEIIPRVYGQQMSHTEMAELAPAVFQAAREADPVATGIVRSAGRELGLMAAAAISKLELTGQVKIGLVGSLFKSRDLLLDAIGDALGTGIRAEFISPRLDPAGGAVLVALKEAGVELTEEIMVRLEGQSG